jgi:GNAT superfamily N-acetyltransferase
MSLALIDITESSLAKRHFFSLPEVIYKDDTNYCRPFSGSLSSSICPDSFGRRQRILVVLENGQSVGRVVASISAQMPHLGTLGFFESLNRKDAVQMLLNEAIRWLLESGAQRIIGPMDSDTWHNYRMNLGPFGTPPFLMEPYNPPYYPALWENCGFKVSESYYSKRLNDVGPVLQALEPIYRKTLSEGYTLRPINTRQFDKELRLIYDLSKLIFADNPFFSPISYDVFVIMYREFRWLIDDDLVWFALAPNGQHIGFLFCMRNFFDAIKSMKGKRSLFSLLTFMLKRRFCDSINFKTIGVLPEHRSHRIASTLMYQAYRRIWDKGYRKANLCLIREDNYSGNLDREKGEIMRRYALYEWTGQHPLR